MNVFILQSKIIISALVLFFLNVESKSVPHFDSNVTVKGILIDDDNEPITGATIALYSTERNLLTGTTSGLDGSFEFVYEAGTYILEISFISFETIEKEIDLTASILNLGEISLSPDTTELDEVVVESEPAVMEMRFDRRIFRPDNEMEVIGGSVLDMMETIPSIETDFEGNISLRGSENVTVLINGRPSPLLRDGTSALEAIPSDYIERVEVITNPSARYGAQGDAGIINIVLKRNRAVGLNGSISTRFGTPDDYRLSTNLNFMTNNANWFTNFGFRYRDRPSERSRFQQFNSPDTSFVYSQDQERIREEFGGDVRVGAEIFLGEQQILTPSVFFRYRDRSNTSDTFYRDMDLSGTMLREVFREDLEDSERTNFEFDLKYEFNISNNNDEKLTADFQVDYQPEMDNSNLREFDQLTGSDISVQRTDNQEEVTNLRFNVDYVRPIGEFMEMEAGLRSSIRWVDNQYRVEELQNNEWVPFDGFNDNFRYTQNINATYGIFSGQFGDFSAQAGLRLEQTRIDTELTLNGDTAEQRYLNLFPSFFVNYEINNRNSIQASYSRRLTRPRFRNILPFSNFRDSRDIFIGNPELNPVFSNSYELSYLTLWDSGSVSASIYHRYRTGVIEQITQLNDDGVTTRFPINLSTQTNWGTELAISQRIFNDLRLRASANYFYSDTEGIFNNQIFERTAQAFSGRVRLQWRISRQINLQTTYSYSGPRQTTQGRNASSYTVNSGVSIRMFDGNATLSISGRDLLNTRNRTRIIDEPFFYSEDESRWSTRSFRLNFIWRFNRLNS